MAQPTTQPTAVTLVQNAQNQITAIRVGEITIPVLTAGIIPGAGCTNLTLAIPNVVLSYEREPA